MYIVSSGKCGLPMKIITTAKAIKFRFKSRLNEN